mmetsp:Transcript_57304/g.167720  ORF Transcript_57304/g.167720 Transcript_57304/m.167720 type:complete len:376 (+) Transcript_57304:264-1391(+)
MRLHLALHISGPQSGLASPALPYSSGNNARYLPPTADAASHVRGMHTEVHWWQLGAKKRQCLHYAGMARSIPLKPGADDAAERQQLGLQRGGDADERDRLRLADVGVEDGAEEEGVAHDDRRPPAPARGRAAGPAKSLDECLDPLREIALGVSSERAPPLVADARGVHVRLPEGLQRGLGLLGRAGLLVQAPDLVLQAGEDVRAGGNACGVRPAEVLLLPRLPHDHQLALGEDVLEADNGRREGPRERRGVNHVWLMERPEPEVLRRVGGQLLRGVLDEGTSQPSAQGLGLAPSVVRQAVVVLPDHANKPVLCLGTVPPALRVSDEEDDLLSWWTNLVVRVGSHGSIASSRRLTVGLQCRLGRLYVGGAVRHADG